MDKKNDKDTDQLSLENAPDSEKKSLQRLLEGHCKKGHGVEGEVLLEEKYNVKREFSESCEQTTPRDALRRAGSEQNPKMDEVSPDK